MAQRFICLALLSIAGQFRADTFVDGLAPAVTARGPLFHRTGYPKPTFAKKQLSRGVFDRGEIKLTPQELCDAKDRFEQSLCANNEPSAICTQMVCLSFFENDGKAFGGGGLTYHTNNLKAKSAQWQLRSILSQPEKGRDDVTIKICPLEPLGDSQLSDKQYAKAMSLKAEQVSKESKKLAEQQASRAEKEASRAEKEASEAEKAASKAEKAASKAEKAASKAGRAASKAASEAEKLAPFAELAKTEAALQGAKARCEATRADVYERACTRIDETDYVQNRTRAAQLCIVGEDCDDDDVPLDLMPAVAAKVEDLREQEFDQAYHQLLNESNHQKLVSEAKELANALRVLRERLRNWDDVSEKAKAAERAKANAEALAKACEAAKVKAKALAKAAEEAKTKAEEAKARVAAPAKDDGAMSDESSEQDADGAMSDESSEQDADEDYEQDDDEEECVCPASATTGPISWGLDDLIYTGEAKCQTTLDGHALVGHYPADKTMPKLTMCDRLSEENLHIFFLTCQSDDFQGAFVAIAADMVKPMLTGEWYPACKGKSWKGCIPVPVDTACPRDPPSAFGVDYVTTVGPSGTKALWKAAGKTWEPVSNDAAFGQMTVSAAQLLNVVKAGVGGVKQCAIEELEQTVQYELLRANTEGTITPTTLKKAHLTARSLTRGTHNNTLTETRTAAEGEVGARVFGEMKASSNKEFEPGIYGSFTVASVVVDEDARRHDALRVGVNVSDNKYLPLLVYHTGAVVVQVRVKSLAQCHDVPAEALEDPFYIVMSTESRDVVEDLTYTPAGSERTNGTKIPVAVIAAPYLNKNVKDVEAVKWGTARASEAFKAAVRHGICGAVDLPSKLDEVLAEYYQTMRVQARKLWAGKAAAAEGETTPTTDAGKRGRFVSPKKGQDAGRTRTGGGHVSSTAGGVPF